MVGYDKTKGRRTMFNKCYFWKKDKNIKDKSKLILETKPKGFFYCKKATPQDLSAIVIDDIFRIQRNSITLMTFDYLDVENDDVVKFDNELWRVTNVQALEDERQEQFKKTISKTTFIRIVR